MPSDGYVFLNFEGSLDFENVVGFSTRRLGDCLERAGIAVGLRGADKKLATARGF